MTALTDAPPTQTLDSELAAAMAAAAEPGTNPEAGLRAARRALSWATQLQRSADEAAAQAWACTHLSRMGRHAEMLAQSRFVLPRLTEAQQRGLRRELLRFMTLSASEIGAFDVALDAAHELSQVSRDSGTSNDALAAAFLLAVCIERMGDSWQAVRLLTEALAAYGEAAPSHPVLVATNAVCAINLGMAHRLRDTGADEELQTTLASGRRQGDRALALLALVPGDTYEVAVPGNLGETLLLQGHVDAARPLLLEALELASARGLKAHAWRVRTSLADWTLAAGDAGHARQLVLGLIAEMGDGAPQQTAIRAHDSAYRSCRALGLYEEALRHLETAERIDRQRTTSQLRSQSQLFVTRGEADRARAQADLAHADAAWQRQRAAEYAAAAERDALTGLGNRRHLERRCAELLPALAKEGAAVSLALLDVDHFKLVNDTHGHAAGDQVLVQLAQLLRENTRTGDVLARHGGEEFVIVLPGMPLQRAAEVCERLRERVAAHDWALTGGVTVSIGLVASPPHELRALLQRADEAMYRAKRDGRNSVVVA
ncbi:MAG: GGDEF domain-containing protein [Rubrivivax sp.]|nr:GGDEF domain-containing protein [Rubrivivax sp.]